MYQENEIEISRSTLSAVISSVKEPVCLLGGWAVFLTVNHNFNNQQGRDYIGSRDIDLGFHIDENWSDSELQNSTFASSVKILKSIGYYGVGSRFVQHHDLETKKLLTEEQAKTRPKYTMFDLFIDPIVDNIHPKIKTLIGFDPIDEPLLAKVFIEKKFTMTQHFGKEIMLPHVEVLVATKINSVTNRDKEDKRIKDIADIYALMWHSDARLTELKKKVIELCGAQKISHVFSGFTDEDYSKVSNVIGIDKTEISRVISEIK